MTVYAVIGSNCFTGSHIVDALLEDPSNRVLGISRSPENKPLYLPYKRSREANYEFHRIDVVRQFEDLIELLDQRRPQVVINVAALSEVALSYEWPVAYFEINTLAVVKLVNHLRRCDWLECYVHISSAEIFGPCSGPVTEDARFNPSTPYAVSKAAADMYINTVVRNYRCPAIIVRSTNVYGRHQQLFKIIPRTVINLKMGKTIDLHGGGRAIKSFVHIRDVVDGLLLTVAKGKTGTFHFSVASENTVADVVRLVCEKMGCDFQKATRTVGERLGQDSRYWLDCTRAERELGWAPKMPMPQGVAEVIGWIEDNWDEIKAEPLEYVHRA